MTFNFINTTSKSFWVGVFMLLAGIFKSIGFHVPILSDLVIAFYPAMDGGALISAGFSVMFLREAITKR